MRVKELLGQVADLQAPKESSQADVIAGSQGEDASRTADARLKAGDAVI